MTETLAAYFTFYNFDTTLFADDTAMFHSFVFTAVALIVLYRAKYFGAKQPIALRLECTIIDGFRLLNFPMRPFFYRFGTGNGNTNRPKIKRVMFFFLHY
jgi:hypothetical protein